MINFNSINFGDKWAQYGGNINDVKSAIDNYNLRLQRTSKITPFFTSTTFPVYKGNIVSLSGTPYTVMTFVGARGNASYIVQRPDEYAVWIDAGLIKGSVTLQQAVSKVPASSWSKGGFNRSTLTQFVVASALAITGIAALGASTAPVAAVSTDTSLSASTGYFGAGAAPDVFSGAGIGSSSITSGVVSAAKGAATALTSSAENTVAGTLKTVVGNETNKLINSLNGANNPTTGLPTPRQTQPAPNNKYAVLALGGIGAIFLVMRFL